MSKTLAVIFLLAACTTAPPPASLSPTWEAARIVEAAGPNVRVVVSWVPGSTDSLYFIVSQGDAEVSRVFLTPPFNPPDTLVLGLRPLPGVSRSWTVSVDAWYADRGTSTRLQQTLGTVTYTEPLPAGVPPTFGPLPQADTTLGSVPPPAAPTLIAVDIWPDSVTVAVGATVQFCGLLLMSDGFWTASLPGDGTPVPSVCANEVDARNARGAVPAADLWMMRMARRPSRATRS